MDILKGKNIHAAVVGKEISARTDEYGAINDLCEYVGCSRSKVYRWKKGVNLPDPEELIRISKFFFSVKNDPTSTPLFWFGLAGIDLVDDLVDYRNFATGRLEYPGESLERMQFDAELVDNLSVGDGSKVVATNHTHPSSRSSLDSGMTIKIKIKWKREEIEEFPMDIPLKIQLTKLLIADEQYDESLQVAELTRRMISESVNMDCALKYNYEGKIKDLINILSGRMARVEAVA